MIKSRIANLDTLRAYAILLVVIFHTTQVFNLAAPDIWQFTQAGFLGVDLFFALSGYLIGSLYFSERKMVGSVQTIRFIARRILRTVPLYFIVLLISFLAVYFKRNQTFDFGYLVFLQNYYDSIPFFRISWSLSVEEHFYFVLPNFLAFYFFIDKKSSIVLVYVLFFLTLLPLWLRLGYQYFDQVHDESSFGFYKTATHLRFDTLAFGVMFSYLAVHYHHIIHCLTKFRIIIYLVTVFLFLSYSFWPTQWMYSIGRYLIGLFFAMTVALACEDKTWSISKMKIISMIAASAYSISVLSHSL